MSKSLFIASLKGNSKNISNFAIGSVLYLWILIWVFPSMSSAKGLNDLIKSMPEALQKVTGLQSGVHKLNDFLAGEYYGLIFVLLLMVYSIIASTQLVARLVDKGAMAYLVATPVSRAKIILTQASVLILGLLTIVIFTYVGGLIGAEWFIEKSDLDKELFLKMNLVGGLLFLVVCAYSFFFSCLFNDEKKAMSISAGVTVLFYGLDMLGKLSDKFEWMRNISLFNLFQPQEIISGDYDVVPTSIGLLVSAIVIFGLSTLVFKKRDLPL
ncbi:ABC transporter permease [Bacillus cereus]|uniref:ABC transporter permease subunit n=1 Tax=Bacillus TaxID=1386 RepID=UPI000BF4006B|nr:ABC transporter permease subunit [Bacillus sp. AFS023182]PFE01009.1 ABC transporter permease [Bacillus sp. AFS023182]PGX91128.1 ABC transporter permease [Bacillus cereus]